MNTTPGKRPLPKGEGGGEGFRTFLALALLLLAPSARADFFSRTGRGTTSGAALSLGPSARAIGMGEAFTSVADDASAVFWNPGALVLVPKASLSFTHAPYLASIYYDNVSFVSRLSPRTLVGGSVQYLDYGSIDGTDVNNLDTQAFHPRDYVYTLSYARDLDFVSFGNEQYGFGVNAKLLRSTIVESASAFAVDVGILSRYDFPDGHRLKAGLVVQNIGGGLRYDQASDPLPTTFRAGASYPLLKNWLFSADAVLPKGNGLYFAGGTELTASLGPEIRGALRAGINTLTLSDLRESSGLAFGAGLTISLLSFDYAFLPMGELGATHRLSVTLRFPGKIPAAEESIFEIQKKLLEP